MRLDKTNTQLTTCPAVYWEARGCHLVVVKLGEKLHRNQFFYKGYQHYGTGIEEYDDVFTCTLTLLQVQADHEARKKDQAPHKTP